MKKILFAISLCFLLTSCKKEITDIQSEYFIKFYGDEFDDSGCDIELSDDGGYVIAGTSQRTATGNSDIIIITTDKFGLQNSETIFIGGDGDEICTGMLVMGDGYVITGSAFSGGIENLLFMKIGKDGSTQWTGPADVQGRGNDVALINDRLVLSGYLDNFGQKKPMLWSFSLQGESVDLYTPTFNPGDYFTSVFNRNNQVFGFGTKNRVGSNTDLFITGAAIAEKIYEFSGNETSSRIVKSASGGFYLVGTSNPVGSGFNQIIVKKLNEDLSENLSFNTNPIGSDGDYRGVDIQEMADGSVAVLGDRTLNNDADIVLYILNTDGTTRVVKIYGKTGNQSASSLKTTADGGLLILGTNQQEKTNSMITLLKTDKDGNIWEQE